MTDGDMLFTTFLAVTPGSEWCWLAGKLTVAYLLLAVVLWWLLGRPKRARAADGCWCGSCGVDFPDDPDDGQVGGHDDLMALADAVFDRDGDVLRPVNEPLPTRWPGLNMAGPNAGPWHDGLPRGNEANPQWLTGGQQARLGEVLATEVEQHLVFEAAKEQARQARWDAVKDAGSERGGEPGE